MKDLDLIIFDLDGTLYQKDETIIAAIKEAAINMLAKLKGINREKGKAEFLSLMEQLSKIIQGKPTYTLTLLYYFDIDYLKFEREVNKLVNIESLLIPDQKTIDVMEKISNYYPVFLYTTNNGTTADRILKCLALDEYFPQNRRVSVSTLVEFNLAKNQLIEHIKPAQRGFWYILNSQNAKPKKTLMVGDSQVSDILPAEKLNMQTYHIQSREDLYGLPEWLGLVS